MDPFNTKRPRSLLVNSKATGSKETVLSQLIQAVSGLLQKAGFPDETDFRAWAREAKMPLERVYRPACTSPFGKMTPNSINFCVPGSDINRSSECTVLCGLSRLCKSATCITTTLYWLQEALQIKFGGGSYVRLKHALHVGQAHLCLFHTSRCHTV